MKRILFLCWLCVCGCLQAQERLERPLAFVNADSTVVWGGGKPDFRATALAADATLTSQPVRLPDDAARRFKADARRWREELLPRLNLVGGLDDANRSGQTEGATQVVGAAAPLLLQTADAQYADAIERAVFNALCAEASAPGPMSFDKHVAAQTLMDAAGMLYATDAEGVYVNLYLNSSTHIVTSDFDFILDQMTAMPFDGLVKLRLTGLGPGRHRLKLRFRIPSWALRRACPTGGYTLSEAERPVPQIYVNGKEPLQLEFVNGYAVVDREWITGDEVYFVLPVQPVWAMRPASAAAQPAARVLLCGLLVYAPSDASAGARCPAEVRLQPAPELNSQGNPVLEVHAAGADSAAVALTLEPYMDVAGPVWLEVGE